MTAKEPVPWTPRDCLWASLPAAAILAIGVVRKLLGLAPSTGAMTAVAIALTDLALLLPVYATVTKRSGDAADLGFIRARWGQSARLVAGSFLVLGLLMALWRLIEQRFHFAMQPDLLERFGYDAQGFLLALLFGALVGPVAEEVFFRGFLFAGLRRRYPFWIAAWGSGLIFGTIHLVPGAILPISVLGFLLAWMRERTGSLWPSVAMHVLNNALYFAARYAIRHLPHP